MEKRVTGGDGEITSTRVVRGGFFKEVTFELRLNFSD